MNVPSKLYRATEYCFLGALFILPFAKAGFEILFALALFSWVMTKIISHGSFCANRGLFILISLFVMSSSASAFGSGYPETAFRGIIKLLKYAFVMLVAIDLFTQFNRLKRLLAVGLCSFGLVLLDALIQNIFGREVISSYPIQYANEQIRLTGPYAAYGLLAAHAIALLPVLMSLTIRTEKTSVLTRIGWGILLLAALYMLYRTQSRGGWIAAFGSLLIYGLLTRHKWFSIILVAMILIVPFVLPKKVLFHVDLFGREASLVERNLLWRRAISVIKARPWFGCGINTYIKNYPKYTKGVEWDLMKKEALKDKYAGFGEKENWRVPGHPDQIPSHYAHNGYLQLAAETGLISFALFLVILGTSFRSGLQAFQAAKGTEKLIIAGLISGLLALLLHAAVDTTLHNLQSAVLIWGFLGLLIVIRQNQTRESRA